MKLVLNRARPARDAHPSAEFFTSLDRLRRAALRVAQLRPEEVKSSLAELETESPGVTQGVIDNMDSIKRKFRHIRRKLER
jgi:hypothetical protein